MLSDEEGASAVRLARASGAAALRAGRNGAATPELGAVFRERRGVFVTWRRFPSSELRGCIGFPLPVLPLERAIAEAAVAAATEDPRFPRVRAEELPALTVEVSVLTVPETIRADAPVARLGAVVAGRDGLIVEGFGTQGLLLPQVATEMGWSAEELLDGTCEKAGLRPGAWRDPRVTVRRFAAEVFAETRPEGPIKRAAPPAG